MTRVEAAVEAIADLITERDQSEQLVVAAVREEFAAKIKAAHEEYIAARREAEEAEHGQ